MISAIIAFLFSIIASAIFTFVGLKAAARFNFFDFPGKAKIHKKPIPYLGGLGIFAGTICGVLAAKFSSNFHIVPIFIAGILAFFFGLADDLKLVTKVWAKTLLTLVIAVAVTFGFQQQFNFNFLIAIAAIFWIFFTINAENLLDGLDGLSAGTTAIKALGFAVLGFLLQNNFLIFFGLILAGSCIGFLFFNFNPAKIFMGSSGSWQLGIFNGIISIIFMQSQNFSIQSIFTIFLANSILFFDVFTTIFRRIAAKKSVFLGDTMHFYNILSGKFGHKRTVLLLCSIQSILSTISIIFLTAFFG